MDPVDQCTVVHHPRIEQYLRKAEAIQSSLEVLLLEYLIIFRPSRAKFPAKLIITNDTCRYTHTNKHHDDRRLSRRQDQNTYTETKRENNREKVGFVYLCSQNFDGYLRENERDF